MVVELIFSSQATSLVDISAVSSPTAHSLKTCGILLHERTAHFRVSLYGEQSKTHLCDVLHLDISHLPGG